MRAWRLSLRGVALNAAVAAVQCATSVALQLLQQNRFFENGLRLRSIVFLFDLVFCGLLVGTLIRAVPSSLLITITVTTHHHCCAKSNGSSSSNCNGSGDAKEVVFPGPSPPTLPPTSSTALSSARTLWRGRQVYLPSRALVFLTVAATFAVCCLIAAQRVPLLTTGAVHQLQRTAVMPLVYMFTCTQRGRCFVSWTLRSAARRRQRRSSTAPSLTPTGCANSGTSVGVPRWGGEPGGTNDHQRHHLTHIWRVAKGTLTRRTPHTRLSTTPSYSNTNAAGATTEALPFKSLTSPTTFSPSLSVPPVEDASLGDTYNALGRHESTSKECSNDGTEYVERECVHTAGEEEDGDEHPFGDPSGSRDTRTRRVNTTKSVTVTSAAARSLHPSSPSQHHQLQSPSCLASSFVESDSSGPLRSRGGKWTFLVLCIAMYFTVGGEVSTVHTLPVYGILCGLCGCTTWGYTLAALSAVAQDDGFGCRYCSSGSCFSSSFARPAHMSEEPSARSMVNGEVHSTMEYPCGQTESDIHENCGESLHEEAYQRGIHEGAAVDGEKRWRGVVKETPGSSAGTYSNPPRVSSATTSAAVVPSSAPLSPLPTTLPPQRRVVVDAVGSPKTSGNATMRFVAVLCIATAMCSAVPLLFTIDRVHREWVTAWPIDVQVQRVLIHHAALFTLHVACTVYLLAQRTWSAVTFCVLRAGESAVMTLLQYLFAEVVDWRQAGGAVCVLVACMLYAHRDAPFVGMCRLPS